MIEIKQRDERCWIEMEYRIDQREVLRRMEDDQNGQDWTDDEVDQEEIKNNNPWESSYGFLVKGLLDWSDLICKDGSRLSLVWSCLRDNPPPIHDQDLDLKLVSLIVLGPSPIKQEENGLMGRVE